MNLLRDWSKELHDGELPGGTVEPNSGINLRTAKALKRHHT